MHRKSRRTAATLDLDDSFPTPLTSRNLLPRSEARTAGCRPERPVLLMPPKRTASSSASSSRIKRPQAESHSNLPRKRARKAKRESSEEEESQEEEDQLVDDDPVETIILPSEIQEAANRVRRAEQEHEQAGSGAGPSHLRNSPASPPIASSSGSAPVRDDSPPVAPGSSKRLASAPPVTRAEPEPLSSYSCPICFFPPTNATMTPCGHICCGSCLFTAVKTMTQRGAMMPEASVARCPVCRAPILGWDGKGGGVIGLKIRAMFSL